jgi:hypothetical protein
MWRPRDLKLVAPRTFVSPDFESLPQGAGVIVRHFVYTANAFTVDAGCSDVTFDGVTIYGAPGEGFVVWNTDRGFRIANCTIGRRPGTNRVCSTTADGANFNNVRGDIVIENCDFSSQGDDAVNIHATWMGARARVDARTVEIDRFDSYNPIDVGDTLRFVRRGTLGEYATRTVASVRSLTPRVYWVTFDAALPPNLAPGDLVANLSRSSARFAIRNNVFHDNRARGMLVQSPDGVVENNRVERSQMAALQVTASVTDFYEGPGTGPLLVRNNTFVGCNYSLFGPFLKMPNMACVNVTAAVRDGMSRVAVHRDIRIEGNVVVDTPGLAFLVSSCEGVTLANNTVERANTRPWSEQATGEANNTVERANTRPWSEQATGEAVDAKASGSIMITRASRVAVTGNRELVFSGGADKGIYVDPRNTSEVTLDGNTQGWIVPAVASVSEVDGKRVAIHGRNFDGALRVTINGVDRTSALRARSDTSLELRGSAKTLGLTRGANTVQVVNPLETQSNVFTYVR